MVLLKYIPPYRKEHGACGQLSQLGRKHEQQIMWKALPKTFFSYQSSLCTCAVGPVMGVRYCVALTLKPGQTEKWHLESDPVSAWPALHPFSLECRWKHEPALQTFLASSGMALDGPQVSYLQLIWILCTSKVLPAKDNPLLCITPWLLAAWL